MKWQGVAKDHQSFCECTSAHVGMGAELQGIANELEEWFGLPKFRVGRVLWNDLCCQGQQGELQSAS